MSRSCVGDFSDFVFEKPVHSNVVRLNSSKIAPKVLCVNNVTSLLSGTSNNELELGFVCVLDAHAIQSVLNSMLERCHYINIEWLQSTALAPVNSFLTCSNRLHCFQKRLLLEATKIFHYENRFTMIINVGLPHRLNSDLYASLICPALILTAAEIISWKSLT